MARSVWQASASPEGAKLVDRGNSLRSQREAPVDSIHSGISFRLAWRASGLQRKPDDLSGIVAYARNLPNPHSLVLLCCCFLLPCQWFAYAGCGVLRAGERCEVRGSRMKRGTQRAAAKRWPPPRQDPFAAVEANGEAKADAAGNLLHVGTPDARDETSMVTKGGEK